MFEQNQTIVRTNTLSTGMSNVNVATGLFYFSSFIGVHDMYNRFSSKKSDEEELKKWFYGL
jgi:hypothetical protein